MGLQQFTCSVIHFVIEEETTRVEQTIETTIPSCNILYCSTNGGIRKVHVVGSFREVRIVTSACR